MKWGIKNADWYLYQSLLSNHDISIQEDNNIDDIINNLTSAIVNAGRNAIGIKGNRNLKLHQLVERRMQAREEKGKTCT